jgi:Flp pilus assembly protein CpaB
MKKNNVVKLLVIAFVVAIISTGIFYGLFVSKMSSSTGSGKVLVAALKTLKPGTVVQSGDLKTIPWPSEQLPPGTYGSIEQVAGSTVLDTIAENELLLESKMASTQSGGGTGVPAGMRAVSVHVTDSTGVMALLRAGQKVDVQVVVAKKDGPVSVRTALEDLKVLSVSQSEPTSQGFTLPVVTLLAKPLEADVLAAGDAGARIRLVLRNPLDTDLRLGTQLNLDTVMRGSGPQPESKAKPKPKTNALEKPTGGSVK